MILSIHVYPTKQLLDACNQINSLSNYKHKSKAKFLHYSQNTLKN